MTQLLRNSKSSPSSSSSSSSLSSESTSMDILTMDIERNQATKRNQEHNEMDFDHEFQLHNDNNEDNGKSDPTSAAQIYTRSTILPNLSALDAGDVIECYALVRNARLEFPETMVNGNDFNSNSNSNNNINNHLEVRKTAIAFRYKPKSSSPDVMVKSDFELTLEYGPQRTGSTQIYEAMPFVNGRSRDLDGLHDFRDGGRYVTWENHAKIYYTLSISQEDWQNAYFMAPITGAVLSKILNDYVLDYPIHHPRYQPFTVVEKPTSKTILRSSNSEDFVWNVFQALADMYVSVNPVLTPKRYGLQLYVEDASRDVKRLNSASSSSSSNTNSETVMNVANAAAQFYDKIYSCLGAIKSGDYSAYEKTAAPSVPPSRAPTAHPTAEPTIHLEAAEISNTTTPKISPTNATDDDDNYGENSGEGEEEGEEEANGDTDANDTDNANDTNDTSEVNDETDKTNIDAKENEGSNDLRSLDSYVADALMVEREKGEGEGEERNGDFEVGTTDDNYYQEEFDNDSSSDTEEENFVEDAENAAQEAMKAAETAKEIAESFNENKAAEAAEQAAEAAQKAAIATSEAAAKAATENLLSGDGAMMSSIISTCFSDPKYNIRLDDIDGSGLSSIKTTNAFLYIDGSHYYRLNMTSPYITAKAVRNPIPTPNFLEEGKGDIVDITLAFAIITGFFFGIIVMLHHIRLLNLDSRLNFAWFFHPTKFQGDHKRLDCLSDDEDFDLQLHIENGDDDDDEEDDDNMYRKNGQIGNGSHHSIELSRSVSKKSSSESVSRLNNFENTLVDMSDH